MIIIINYIVLEDSGPIPRRFPPFTIFHKFSISSINFSWKCRGKQSSKPLEITIHNVGNISLCCIPTNPEVSPRLFRREIRMWNIWIWSEFEKFILLPAWLHFAPRRGSPRFLRQVRISSRFAPIMKICHGNFSKCRAQGPPLAVTCAFPLSITEDCTTVAHHSDWTYTPATARCTPHLKQFKCATWDLTTPRRGRGSSLVLCWKPSISHYLWVPSSPFPRPGASWRERPENSAICKQKICKIF